MVLMFPGENSNVKFMSSNFIYFTIRLHLKNYEKCILFYKKSSFCSQDIQMFILSSLSEFSPVGLC